MDGTETIIIMYEIMCNLVNIVSITVLHYALVQKKRLQTCTVFRAATFCTGNYSLLRLLPLLSSNLLYVSIHKRDWVGDKLNLLNCVCNLLL